MRRVGNVLIGLVALVSGLFAAWAVRRGVFSGEAFAAGAFVALVAILAYWFVSRKGAPEGNESPPEPDEPEE